MAAPQNFRSALNGFNREDVVHYIEYLNARHTSEVNQLQAELDLLRSRAAAPAAELDALRAECRQLRQELAEAQERCMELETRPAATEQVENPLNQQLEQRCAALEAQLRKTEAERDNARAGASASRVEQELEAYRRAERTERVARERAEQVYHQVNGVLADASAKVDEAYAQISDLTDRVSLQLAQLQEAVTGSRQALTDASATLYAIRPTGDNS